VSVTGYNENMIISKVNGAANITAVVDDGTSLGAGNYTFYEQGYNTTSPTAGVPLAGTIFGSANDPNHTFELAPNGPGQNDALMLDSTVPNGTLVLSGSTKYSELSFLASGANGGGPVNYTINYGGGGTQTGTLTIGDWFNGTPIAFDANGRADVDGNFQFTTNGNPRMYQFDVALSDTADPVTSVNLSWGGTQREVVYGLSGQAIPVPEPATWALVAAAALVLCIRRRLVSAVPPAA
jgi:hypothetical protein